MIHPAFIKEIPELANNIIDIMNITHGWSKDRKYKVRVDSGETFLLRISSESEKERKLFEYESMRCLSNLNGNISKPIAFGNLSSTNEIYTLLTWINGEDAVKVMTNLTETEQYHLGFKAGQILKKIHSIGKRELTTSWSEFYNSKLDQSIENYKNCAYRFNHDEIVLDFIEGHRQLLEGRPITIQHGDFHLGNMVISDDNELGIIDFNRLDYGDPWEEFDRMIWTYKISRHFATGQINGYFSNEPPEKFFQLMALYSARGLLSSIPWAIPFGDREIQIMLKNAEVIFESYQGFETIYPLWYLKNVSC
ncbi:MAG: aph [Bacillales bacterium]|jgi:aminoglycoside phosphotransferase (APT) family kinase protein|nr:aph [Bacillales bacterium]